MADPVLLLDGGMGQELMRRSTRPVEPLWSARTIQHEPELVIAAHRDFIAAGAQVVTVASYSVTPPRLAAAGEDERFERLQATACDCAEAARAAEGAPVAIAGCLPPLVRSYRPDLAPDLDSARRDYERIVAAQAPRVDLILCETLSTLDEVEAAVGAAAQSGLPVWCAMTVDDADGTRLRGGAPMREAAEAALAAGARAALANCSSPEAITAATPELAAAGAPFGGYANGFVSVDHQATHGEVSGLRAREDATPAAYAETALGWVETGATLIGGCCEIGPEHIAALRDRLSRAGRPRAAAPLRPPRA